MTKPDLPAREPKVDILYLVRVYGTDIHFVVEFSVWESAWADQTDDFSRYYVEEHTCPTNLIGGGPILKVIHRGDTDPHGVLAFVQVVKRPADFRGDLQGEDAYDYWKTLFDRLP